MACDEPSFKNNDIMKLDAEKARKLSEAGDEDELREILLSIEQKIKSKYDNKRLSVYNKNLRESTIKSLECRGFKITNHSGLAIQKENLYHTILW